MPAEYYGRDPYEPSPEDQAELDEEREFLTRHGIDDDPAEADPLVWDRTELTEEDAELIALPPATDSPTDVSLADVALVVAAVEAYTPRQLPCEVCGLGVLTSYVETHGGRQRHGHHPEGS